MRLDTPRDPLLRAPVLILGGGISGLATAWFLHQHGVPVKVLESRSYPGGNLLTTREQGYLVEHGPNSTLQKPEHPDDALGRLIASLGLTDKVQVAGENAKKRYILRGGRLIALPASPPAFLFTSAFSWSAKLRLLAEPFIGRGRGDESIAAFVRRRLGQEFLDYAIDPFISGVYAGNTSMLSVRAAVPKIHALEEKYGSLIRGALATGKAMKGAGMPRGRMISFDGGMETLPRTIAARLPEGTVVTGAEAREIIPLEDEGWRVTWQGEHGVESALAKRVILALPAPAVAQLIQPFAAAASRILKGIPYAPIASVGLGYRRAQVQHPLDGFGMLAPRKEKLRTLGALFSSSLFPQRAPEEHVLITSFIGGTLDHQALEMEDTPLVEQVERDLAQCLDIQGKWAFLMLTRYRRAIPQYIMGHLEKMAEVERTLARFPGLHVRANWRDGISVADCVLNAERLANQLAEWMRD